MLQILCGPAIPTDPVGFNCTTNSHLLDDGIVKTLSALPFMVVTSATYRSSHTDRSVLDYLSGPKSETRNCVIRAYGSIGNNG